MAVSTDGFRPGVLESANKLSNRTDEGNWVFYSWVTYIKVDLEFWKNRAFRNMGICSNSVCNSHCVFACMVLMGEVFLAKIVASIILSSEGTCFLFLRYLLLLQLVGKNSLCVIYACVSFWSKIYR